MQVSVEQVSAIERRLTVNVPSDEVQKAYQQELKLISKTAKLKGFRPGKASLSHIEREFGGTALKEALGKVIEKTLYAALAEKQLVPVAFPDITSKSYVAAEPFEFTASFEILPTIETVQFNMDSVEKLSVEIIEEDVQRVIDQLQKQQMDWDVVDRPAQLKDRLVIDYHAVFAGVADMENKVERFPIELGGAAMLPGFEEGMLGASAGEDRVLHLTFPADFDVPEKAGQAVDFVVHVHKVLAADQPEINDAFVKRLGIASGQLEDLKKHIKHTLELERQRIIQEKMKDQVFQRLLEQNPVEVPKALVSKEANKIHDEIYQHDHNHKHQHSDGEMVMFNEIAKKRVALGILLSAYVKQKDLKVDEGRVQKRINDIALAYENPQEVVGWLSAKERRGNIEGQVIEDQIIDLLTDGIPVVEKKMTYAELKGTK
ncbi:MAG TPA: trigger factor [Gammaproteobacteria bacterium]|jgi:trigger factor|nr:trigger factor [Gammaproteobacteria bacterium]